MPEGHTIHRLAKQHRKLMPVGRPLALSSPQGRFADGAAQVDGHALTGIDAHGKHLFYQFDNGLAVHVHLGMHGAFRALDVPADGPLPEARGQVRMRVVTGDKIVELTGPSACDTLDAAGVATIRNRLGPDVLDPGADPEVVWTRISKSRAPVGGLLMDQSVISGIGNIYRAEVLLRQKVHPLLPGNQLAREAFDRIWVDSCRLLAVGVKLGRIVTVDRSEVDVPLSKVRRADRFNIYRRPTCRRCGGPVAVFTLAGRECYLCPAEQTLPRGVGKPDVAYRTVPDRKRRGAGHG